MRDSEMVKLVVFILVFVLPTVVKWIEGAKKRAASQARRAEPEPFERPEPPPRSPNPPRRSTGSQRYAPPPPPPERREGPVREAHTTGRSSAPRPLVRAAASTPPPAPFDPEDAARERHRKTVPETVAVISRVLHDRKALGRAILLSEVLGPPVSERRTG